MKSEFIRNKEISRKPIKDRELESLGNQFILLWHVAIGGVVLTVTLSLMGGVYTDIMHSIPSITVCCFFLFLFGGTAISANEKYKAEQAYLEMFIEEAKRLTEFVLNRYGLEISGKTSSSLIRGKTIAINIDGIREEVKLSVLPDSTDARLINMKTKNELPAKINIDL